MRIRRAGHPATCSPVNSKICATICKDNIVYQTAGFAWLQLIGRDDELPLIPGPVVQAMQRGASCRRPSDSAACKQPPDLTDDEWGHGSTDGEMFSVAKKGSHPR